MSDLPDAAIQAAAEAIYAARGYEGISHNDTGETRSVWKSSLKYAQVALAAALSGNADTEQVEDKPDGPKGEEDAGNNGVITGHVVDDTPHRFGFGPCSCMSCGR